MANFNQKIIIISGATASGKSQLAVDFAQINHGVIINGDSLQQYHDLPILSALPNLEMQKKVEHQLYGHLDYNEKSSVAQWLAKVKKIIEDIWQKNQLPIVVGGTGLYLSKLIDGINFIPEISNQTKIKAQEHFLELGFEQFKKKYGNDKIIDKQRLIRACEVFLETRQPIEFWQSQVKQRIFPDAEFIHANLALARETIYQNCDLRFASMLKTGAISEVENLLKKNIDLTLPITKTLGFIEIKKFLKKEINFASMQELAQQKTRNYAKRQLTWFRHQFKDINFFAEKKLAYDFLEQKIK